MPVNLGCALPSGRTCSAVRAFLIGAGLGVALVLGVIGWGVYRIAEAVWGGQ